MKRVLIVEDVALNQDLLVQLLPVTNLAARLAGTAAAGQLLVGPETARRLEDRYRLTRLGREHLKNMAEAVDIYHLLGPSVGS